MRTRPSVPHPGIPLLLGLLALSAAPSLTAGDRAPAGAPSEEFFIVSSVNADRGTMVVKRPTEVTLIVRVSGKTRCRNEKGEAIRFTDLRAGDTVFIASVSSSGQPEASSIRLGPMTVEELHRRYLRF